MLLPVPAASDRDANLLKRGGGSAGSSGRITSGRDAKLGEAAHSPPLTPPFPPPKSLAPPLWAASPAGSWAEAYPVGNGNLGAMLWGQPWNDRIPLAEDTMSDLTFLFSLFFFHSSSLSLFVFVLSSFQPRLLLFFKNSLSPKLFRMRMKKVHRPTCSKEAERGREAPIWARRALRDCALTSRAKRPYGGGEGESPNVRRGLRKRASRMQMKQKKHTVFGPLRVPSLAKKVEHGLRAFDTFAFLDGCIGYHLWALTCDLGGRIRLRGSSGRAASGLSSTWARFG